MLNEKALRLYPKQSPLVQYRENKNAKGYLLVENDMADMLMPANLRPQ